ncbi:MAG: dihydrolipoyl dehydrogenase, partial [Candidatus Bathyarchaeota archaeon]|nr:dihydrolipoyl dehydrogenase [Candidatus Bathyarchaeota archaeon]
QLGKRVALIEKDKVGGTCLNLGCIPTKALLATADLLSRVKRSEEFGILMGEVTVDFGKVMARKEAVVNRLIEGVRFLIKKNKISLIEGKATVLSKNQIRVQKPDGSEETFEAENLIMATGLERSKPSYAAVDEEKILTTRGALSLKVCPESLVVIGGGIMGIEFAVIFDALGSDVKILEATSHLLPTLDNEIGRNYQRILKKKGIEVHLNAEVASVKVKPNGKVGITATSRGSQLDIETEKALVTDERKPSSNGLGLENLGVQMKDGFIIVDEHLKTSVPNIYAVGDVTGGKMFAHVAAAEGIVAAENIAGLEATIDYKTVSTCMYCQPEAASVGLSEDEAKRQGCKVSVGKFPLLANGRALTLGETDGFAKVVCDEETGEILGVHLIGPHATDLIGEAALAMSLECTSEELGGLIHPHPTIGEALMEAARNVSKKAIHV